MSEALEDFVGRTVAVTGASSGIGAATARLLAGRGAAIVALGRRKPDFPVKQFVPLDVTDPRAIAEAAAQVAGPLDGLVCSAGVPATSGAQSIGTANYLGVRAVVEALAPKIARGGAIVNVASSSGSAWPGRAALHLALGATASFEDGRRWLQDHPVTDAAAYGYFKEALIVWTKQRAMTLHSEAGIRMNCVSPGPIETPMLAELRAVRGPESLADSTRRAGIGTPEDVAPVIAFLLSPASKWIVATDVAADGGLVASKQIEVQPA